MSRTDWASTQEAVDLVEKPGDIIEYDENGDLVRNTFAEREAKENESPEGSSNEDEEESSEDSTPKRHPRIKDDNEHLTVQVSSNPPPRTENEEAFSQWLHHHPVHETDHEWDQMTLGQGKMHTPQSEEDDVEDENAIAESDNQGQQDSGSDQSSGESGKEPEDYSYVNEWGKK